MQRQAASDAKTAGRPALYCGALVRLAVWFLTLHANAPVPNGHEGEALQRIEAAKSSARGLLSKADSFTEPVIAKDNRKLFRARFAGLERDQAEAVCRALRRTDIPCMTAHN